MPPSDLDPSQEQNISELLAKSEVALSTRNFNDAIDSCMAVLSISPNNIRAREMMEEAQSQMEAELFTRENLKKAEELFREREFQRCITECQKILMLEPDHKEVSALLSKAQQKVEAEPFVQNFVNSGRSLFESGLHAEAIAQWEKVRSIDAEYPDLDRMIESARQKMQSPEDAQASSPMFELSLEPPAESEPGRQDPEEFGFVSDNDRIRQLLDEGDRLFDNEQYQNAIEVWSEIFMLDVNHPDALVRIEKAREAASQQRIKAKDLLRTAQLAYEQGNASQAYDLFRQVKALDPENPEASKYLALLEPGDKEPDSLENLITQGDAAESRGQYREAAQFLSQALAIDSENAELADRIKNLNLLAKKNEQAKTLLGNARAFMAEGKIESARHALTKVLESDPTNAEAKEIFTQLKQAVGTAPAAASTMPPTRQAGVSRPAAWKSPIALAAVLLLVLAGGAYFYFFRTEASNDATTPIQKLPISGSQNDAPANPQPGSVGTGNNNAVAANVPEDNKEKAARILKEANFYFREKRYEEALKMADEALALDPGSKDAIALRMQTKQNMADAQASEQKMLTDANTYFQYSEFAGAVTLYEKYLDRHPESRNEVLPQMLKCYYNLGVIAIREWRCDIAADYFRQVLFLDDRDQMSKDALALARRCQKSGASDIDVRRSVALMEMRR